MHKEFSGTTVLPESQINSGHNQAETIQRTDIPAVVLVEFDNIETGYKTDGRHLGYHRTGYKREVLKKEGGKESVRYYLLGELSIPPLRSIKIHPQPVTAIVVFEDGKTVIVHSQDGDVQVRKE